MHRGSFGLVLGLGLGLGSSWDFLILDLWGSFRGTSSQILEVILGFPHLGSLGRVKSRFLQIA